MFGPSKKELANRIAALSLYCSRLNKRVIELETKSSNIVPPMKPFIRSAN